MNAVASIRAYIYHFRVS